MPHTPKEDRHRYTKELLNKAMPNSGSKTAISRLRKREPDLSLIADKVADFLINKIAREEHEPSKAARTGFAYAFLTGVLLTEEIRRQEDITYFESSRRKKPFKRPGEDKSA